MSNLEFKNGGIVIDGKTYAGGKLYIGNTEKEIDVGRVIVDVSNNNFHLLPQNVGDVHDITDKIAASTSIKSDTLKLISSNGIL